MGAARSNDRREFLIEECTELVVYALSGARLAPGTPCFWVEHQSGLRTGFAAVAECGPFPCVRPKGSLLDALCVALEDERDRSRRAELWALLDWLESSDATRFDVRLEPREIAGQGTAQQHGVATRSEWDVRAGAVHLRSGPHRTIWRLEDDAEGSDDADDVDADDVASVA